MCIRNPASNYRLELCLPVQVVEEGEEVEGELDPALSLALVQGVRVHNGGGIVQAGPGHHGPVHVPAEKN
jgi:hypothetical protein